MALTHIETRVKGRTIRVPAVEIDGRTVMVRGRWFKIASVRGEDLIEGQSVRNPVEFIGELRKSRLKADVLTFFQRPPEVTPKYPYHVEWENYAVVPITTFESWWEKLPQETRKNTRRAAKRGVEVREVKFDDELARGIHSICNETPVRQGKSFWHYGKDFDTIKREFGDCLDCSEFIGAYFDGKLIGFIKMICVDRLVSIVAILASNEHQDKRPMNALIAKAVEICVQKKAGWFAYGNYVYGNKKEDSLVEFKRRNGFERLDFPRYYIPLTMKGFFFVSWRLYRGAVGLLPLPLLRLLLKLRTRALESVDKTAAPQNA